MTVSEAVAARRATAHFDPNFGVPREKLLRVMAAATLAPSSMNLQPWRFLVLESEEDKARLQRVSYGQSKITQASVMIVVLGDLRHHENAPRLVESHIRNGYFGEERRQKWIDQAFSAYGEDLRFQREEMFRGGSLWAMSFMLLALEAGWVTAPMGGFEEKPLIEEFELGDRYLPVLLVAVGRRLKDDLPRNVRLPIEELILPSRRSTPPA